MRINEQLPFGEEPSASEARLRDQIREQLRRRGRVDVTKIGVDVHDHRVLLWGSVASETEREIAGEVARSVAGSKNVLNRVHVYRSSSAPVRISTPRGSRSGGVQLEPGNP